MYSTRSFFNKKNKKNSAWIVRETSLCGVVAISFMNVGRGAGEGGEGLIKVRARTAGARVCWE